MIAIVAAAVTALAAPSDAEKHLAELQSLYEQSCGVRAYAAFDDLCSPLKRQLRDAEKAARKAEQARLKAQRTAGEKQPTPTAPAQD